MARVDEAKYEAMIEALNTFANQVSSAVAEMESIAATSVNAIGAEDAAVGPINEQIRKSREKYDLAVQEAGRIAAAMQEELDEQRKEREVWDGDE